MTCAQANLHVTNAVKERARLYLAVFHELIDRYGENEAKDIMRNVSTELGKEVGQTLTHLGPNNVTGMLDAFFKAPDDGATFQPDVRQLDETGLEVKMMTCPLKDAWMEAGCSDDEVCTLLQCASAYDRAVMETAGFDYELELWSPGKDGCCRTKLFKRLYKK